MYGVGLIPKSNGSIRAAIDKQQQELLGDAYWSAMGCTASSSSRLLTPGDEYPLLQPWPVLSLPQQDRIDALMDAWEGAAVQGLYLKFNAARGDALCLDKPAFDVLLRGISVPQVCSMCPWGSVRMGCPAAAVSATASPLCVLVQGFVGAAFQLFAINHEDLIEFSEFIRVLSLALYGSHEEQSAVLSRLLRSSHHAIRRTVRAIAGYSHLIVFTLACAALCCRVCPAAPAPSGRSLVP